MNAITIATYNIHKGMSALNQKVQLLQMTTALQQLAPDILFLQEVQGYNSKRADNIPDFPRQPHYQILSEQLDYHVSYGRNARYKYRDHGNAILSRHPMITCHNLDISVNKMEQRGLLHCEVQLPQWQMPLVCLCAHLNLREPDRIKQYQTIYDYIQSEIDPAKPMILAGDFNDWRQRSYNTLDPKLNLQDAFCNYHNAPKTFPARLPLLSLDRIFIRHLKVLAAKPLTGQPWQKLSDHLPLFAIISPENEKNSSAH
ncbi:endonuclease/exonuclease/phosphatase family protein [Snodgrassella alvi]|uniref:endonuclease/exonuclease/phosphatase family protein n=1 Tax=Snodgrassella alvi TaxID=1196083 RepID=UPI003460A35E